jgi:hypothetical protein
MNRNRILALVLSSMLLLSGCGKASVPQAQEPTPTVAETKQQETVAPTIPEPEKSPSGMYETVPEGVSSLTGLPYIGDGKAIMVQIENTAAARPQSGISKADLIYEIEVESQITRLTAFFLSSYPSKVGPVRSARKQHMYIWKEWGYMYVFYGGSSKAGQNIYDIQKQLGISAIRIDGMATSAGFSRSSDREAPHNAYTNLDYLIKNKYDFEPKPRTLYFEDSLEIVGEKAFNVELEYASNNRIRYVYDENSKLYKRYINGEPMKDKEDGVQVKVRNIIVQHVPHHHVTGTVYTNMDQIGSGKAEYFTDGVKRTGTWIRESVESLTKYYDKDGKEINFRPGVTFIQIVRPETAVSSK